MKKKEVKSYNVVDYYKPYKNNILLKWEIEDMSEGGVILPDSLKEKKLGLEVVAIGQEVHDIKIGDLVVTLPNSPIGTFSLFNEVYAQIPDYQVFAVISPEYPKAAKEFKEMKDKLEKDKTEIIS